MSLINTPERYQVWVIKHSSNPTRPWDSPVLNRRCWFVVVVVFVTRPWSLFYEDVQRGGKRNMKRVGIPTTVFLPQVLSGRWRARFIAQHLAKRGKDRMMGVLLIAVMGKGGSCISEGFLLTFGRISANWALLGAAMTSTFCDTGFYIATKHLKSWACSLKMMLRVTDWVD